ncbi:MAG: quinol dehydrogenase ferredoxin subunit NapH [Burkholderiaceae bacterium]|nr:quinol dehydrogenase ferredoxin subunit NapH [Burkholderiaceae bacterium]
MSAVRNPGAEARLRFGWWRAHRWLVARRAVQIGIFALFALGPWLGVWIVKGTLASSLTLGVLPLTDPLILLQGLLAGHWPHTSAWIGAGIVLGFYLLVGGRIYCSWVCPINIVTDLAAWLRRRLGVEKGWRAARQVRRWLLAAILVVAALTGSIAFELVNPITTLYRNLLFGVGWGLLSVGLIFLFDAFVAQHGWCGHLCPVGAFYGLLNRHGLVRVAAVARTRCDDCMDCYAVCPEMHVLPPALKGQRRAAANEPLADGIAGTPVIASADCTACGRCIDVCSKDVFRFTHRFDHRVTIVAEPESPLAMIDSREHSTNDARHGTDWNVRRSA